MIETGMQDSAQTVTLRGLSHFDSLFPPVRLIKGDIPAFYSGFL